MAGLPKQNPRAEAALTAKSLSGEILALLPKDGSPVLNRIMRVMLSRKLEQDVDLDLFFEARDLLLASGQIGRLRGQGGQLFLSLEPELPSPAPSIPAAGAKWTEAQLMKPLGAYLADRFLRECELPKSSEWIVHDTSRIGAAGRWTRPDFTLVTAMRFDIMPGVQVDVHSFELKTESGVDTLAVHEALAQTRATHFGHLVWHLPLKSKAESRLDEILKQCQSHGIGLIRLFDPTAPQDSEILLDAHRKTTVAEDVDDFLNLWFTDQHKKKMRKFIHETIS